MSGRVRGGLAAACALALFLALAWIADRLLGLSGGAAVALWVLVGLLGAVAAFFAFRLAAATAPARPKEPDALELGLDQARRKLRAAGGSGPGRVPALVLLGPDGSAKTTAVLRSGIEAELLAGEALRGDQPVPTEAVNVWLARGTLFVEAAPAVMADEERWSRLVRRLRPDRMAAAVGRGELAPRSAVVCFSCEEFLQPGASRAVPETARRLRARLGTLAHALGTRLPVYVLFTKADRIPYFTDYVRNLTDEEARQILGATLEVAELTDPGDHVARETSRLGEAFRTIFRAMARKRLPVLDRENDHEVRLGAYEFPREFLKLADPATEFLVELCRPVQIGVSPFLRGFYFTGVRPVVVRDTAAASAPAPDPGGAPVGATSVFDASRFRQQAEAAPRGAGARKVPQWVFLSRVFREVILADGVARAVTAGGKRVDGLRRSLLGGAAAVLLLAAVGTTTSFLGNRAVAREAREVVQGGSAGALAAGAGLASEELAELERLRALTDTLGRWERDGAPARLRWGLWSGDDLHPVLRRTYFDRFGAALWRPTRSVLVSRLSGLPDEPRPDAEYADYAAAYEDLKAYLVATEYPDSSAAEFMTPVLLSRWQQYPGSEAVPDSAARSHFDFFARELTWSNPYPEPADPQILEAARDYLGAFSGDDQLYQSLLGEASSELAAVRFEERFPGSADVVRSDVTVPGAFTVDGWTRVHERLQNLQGLLAREEWVLGEGRSVSDEEMDRLASSLRARYRQDFVDEWTSYLGAASTARFQGTRDAAAKLSRLSSNQSPLLQALFLASTNTDVDSTAVGPSFQPLHHTAPPSSTDRYVTESNQGYLQALGRLAASMDRLAGSPDAELQNASSAVRNDAAAARQAVADIARAFSIDGPAAQVGNAVQTLLLQPVEAAQRLATSAGPARIRSGLNQAGAAFCQRFGGVGSRFPFSPEASAEATAEDVDAIFRPGDGALWRFYEEELADYMEERGGGYEARTGLPVPLSPTFVRFFNQAAAFSEALYGGGQGPAVAFSFRIRTDEALPAATFRLDGRAHTFTRVQPAQVSWFWDATTARSAAISGTVDGQEVQLLESDRPGTWALFRLFQLADWTSRDATSHELRWDVPGRSFSVVAELRGTSVFRRDFMSGLGCVSQVAR